MKIYIDGNFFAEDPLEDDQEILDRVALEYKTLPLYIRIGKDEIVGDRDERRIEIIVLDLKNMPITVLIQKYEEIALDFSIHYRDVVLKWFQQNGIPEDLAPFKEISRFDYSSDQIIKYQLQELKKRDILQQKQLEERVYHTRKKLDIMKNETPIPLGNLSLDQVDLLYDIDPNVELLDLFDSANASRYIPFMYLTPSSQSLGIYKIFRTHPINEEWLSDKYNNLKDVIVLKILSMKNDKKKEAYALCILSTTKLLIQRHVSDDSFSTDILLKNLTKVFSKYDLRIGKERQSGLKGFFRVPIDTLKFNKFILSDMIMNDSILSTYLFFNEFKKTSTDKGRYYVYYNPSRIGEISTALTLILTSESEEKKGGVSMFLDIRVSRAKTLTQIESFKKIMEILLGRYMSKYDEIVEEYSNMIVAFKKRAELYEKKPKKEREKKTGKRIDALRDIHPELFVEGYGGKCQKSEQPYIIKGEANAKEHLKKLFENKEIIERLNSEANAGADENNLMMNFPEGSDDYYFCAPRESDDKDQEKIWPGLRKNTKLSNRDTHPFLPCCFNKDPHERKGGLQKYLKGEEEDKGATYILRATNAATEGRYAKLPLFLNKLVKDDDVYRFGVMESPNSLLHIMELVTDKDYIFKTKDEKIATVNKVKKDIRDTESFELASQSLFDYSKDDIIELLETEQYFDPLLFVALVEEYYQCNIFLFSGEKGEIQYPRSSIVYLPTDIDESKDTYLIVIFPMRAAAPFPFQCEIICYKDKPRASRYNFQGTKIADDVIKYFYDANDVFSIQMNGNTKIYAPVSRRSPLFEGAVSQWIDDNGKCRGIKYKYQGSYLFLMTSPLPPLDVPANKDIVECDPNLFQPFALEKKLNILMQDVIDKDEIQGIWVDHPQLIYGYMPMRADMFYLLDSAPETMLDPLRVQTISLLKKRERERKIARYLQQYALYLYLIDPYNFGEDSFVIDSGHKYKDFKYLGTRVDRNNVFWFGDKLIVPNSTVRDRLISYINIQVKFDQKEYKEMADGIHDGRPKVSGVYTSLRDFKQTSLSYVFLGKDTLIKWLELSDRKEILLNAPRSDTLDPYFFVLLGKLCIVQNVLEGDIKRAISICEYWTENKINLGFDAPKTDIQEEIYINIFLIPPDMPDVYTYSNGNLKPSDSSNHSEYVLIQYDENHFGSVLYL